MKTIYLSLILMLSGTAHAQSQTNLEVKVQNFKNQDGKLRVALYNNQKSYLKETFKVADTIVYNLNEVTVIFKNIPEGEYAISVYHDQNNNDDLDSNFMGIPTEPYGFSNNAPSRFGPASYEDSAFTLSSSNNVQIIQLN